MAKDVAKVSVVGAGMVSNPGVAAKMFEALYDAGINIRQISTSEIRVSVLIDEKYADLAAQAVHDLWRTNLGGMREYLTGNGVPKDVLHPLFHKMEDEDEYREENCRRIIYTAMAGGGYCEAD